MREILLLLAAQLILSLVYVAATIAIAGPLKIDIAEIRIFHGPRLLTIGRFAVGCIPLGGYVRFRTPAEGDPPEPAGRTLDDSSPWVTIAIFVGGVAALVALAAAVLGAPGLRHFGAGFAEIVAGALAPRTEGARLVTALFDVAARDGFLAFLAVVSAKTAAWNLVPLPMLNGGPILCAFLRLCGRPWTVGGLAATVSLLLVLSCAACWAIALYTALWAGA